MDIFLKASLTKFTTVNFPPEWKQQCDALVHLHLTQLQFERFKNRVRRDKTTVQVLIIEEVIRIIIDATIAQVPALWVARHALLRTLLTCHSRWQCRKCTQEQCECQACLA